MRACCLLIASLVLTGCNGWEPATPSVQNTTQASTAANLSSQVTFDSPPPGLDASPPSAPPLTLEEQNEARLASQWLAGVPTPPPSAPAPLTGAEQDFMRSVSSAEVTQIQWGRLAVAQGQQTELKKLARQLVEDHSRAHDELRSLARQFSVALPTDAQPPPERLVRAKGQEFDRAYVSLLVQVEPREVDLFREEVAHGLEPTLHKWATRRLAILERQLAVARRF